MPGLGEMYSGVTPGVVSYNLPVKFSPEWKPHVKSSSHFLLSGNDLAKPEMSPGASRAARSRRGVCLSATVIPGRVSSSRPTAVSDPPAAHGDSSTFRTQSDSHLRDGVLKDADASAPLRHKQRWEGLMSGSGWVTR